MNSLAEARQLPAWSSWKNGRPAGWFDLPMTQEAADSYKENGFLVIEGAVSPQEIEELRAETLAMCRGERGEVGGIDPASTQESDEEVLRKTLCIHFPDRISPLFRADLAHPSIIQVLTQIISPNVKCMQSMLFVKASGKPGQAWHQDEFYIPTRDRSLTGAWIAMDDATVENGCLWVIPGSQKRGILWEMFLHDDRRFDCSAESRGWPWTNDDAVPVEVKAGSIVFFNGYTLHRSLPNTAAAGFRRSLVNHYCSAETLLPWFNDQMHKGPFANADYRDILLVAGEDPYAYKGTVDFAKPHVRASGEGGCGNQEKNAAPDDDHDH